MQTLLKKGKLFSVLLWGLPGSGKSTLARLLAKQAQAHFIELSAIGSGVKELRGILDEARERKRLSRERTLLFIDEIYHYNKTQQDALLHDLERGNIILLGASTENPAFQLIPALLSRVQLLRLPPLSNANLQTLIQRDIWHLAVSIEPEAMPFLLRYATGDGRSVLNLLELAAAASSQKQISVNLLQELAPQARL